jgi:predicted Rossmann fold flavoprotein
MSTKTLIVIGGGAAGIFCAINAARLNPNLKVSVLEKSSKLLGKVKISGGGRCNVTHACFDIALLSKKYPRGEHFVKKAFHQFFTSNTIEWFKARGVELEAEEDGRMFPVTDSSQTIIDCLIKEANHYKVEMLFNRDVISVEKKEGKWLVLTTNDYAQEADYICVASGGYPKSSMFDWLTKLGHHIEEPVPSLFTFNMPSNEITKLMGIAVPDVQIKITGSKLIERGPALITHWGLSGPAVLRLSAWGARELAVKNYQFSISVNWLPEFNEHTLREKMNDFRVGLASQRMLNKNPFGLPQRLWEYLTTQSGISENKRWADLGSKEQNGLIKNLVAQSFEIKGKTTFKEEFVTAGGIKLSEIDANTMQSKLVPSLFFAGEVMDVDGITGGFNFQHAWTSGYVAANSIATLR